MNPYRAYQQQTGFGMSRIDMLLALYDGALERLGQACYLLGKGELREAQPLLARVQVLVGGLASGVDASGGTIPQNLLRLYEFVVHCCQAGNLDKVEAALRVMRTLQEGMQAIRPEAMQLERDGQIPALDTSPALQATA